MEKVLVEPGKRYERRDGKITGVIEESQVDDLYRFWDPEHRFSYTKTGALWDGESNPLDLIREYKEVLMRITNAQLSELLAVLPDNSLRRELAEDLQAARQRIQELERLSASQEEYIALMERK